MIQSVSKYITGHTATHICIKGNQAAQNDVINAVASEMRGFLSMNKGKKLPFEQIQSFYKKLFPDLNVHVQEAFIRKDCLGYFLPAYDWEEYKLRAFIIGLKSSKKPNLFKINSNSADTLIHETIHLIQSAIKAETAIFKNWMIKHKNKENMLDICPKITDTYRKHVYIWAHDYISPVFEDKVNKELREIAGKDKLLHMRMLKHIIRRAQEEQQAFETAFYHTKLFKHPLLARFEWYRNMVKESAHEKIEAEFKFQDKIKTLKETYFKLAEEIQEKMLKASKTVKTSKSSIRKKTTLKK